MTRMYEALTKSGGTDTDAILAALDQERAENARILGNKDEVTGGNDAATAEFKAVALEIESVAAEQAAMMIALEPVAANQIEAEPPVMETEYCAPALLNPETLSGFRQIDVHVESNGLVFPFEGADRATADQYRVLRTNIVHHPAHPSLIVVSSATAGDGKTLTAINMAGILAWKNEGDVLLVDADLRRRSVARVLGITEQPGFADVLQGRCALEHAISAITKIPKLHVMTAGTPSINPAELLDSTTCRDVLKLLRGRFQYVIVDTAPIGVLTDFDLIQGCCDGVLVVVRQDHTQRNLLKEALTHLPADAVLGVVLNGHQDWLLSKSSMSYAYSYDSKTGEPWA